jgi:hypothetical protein
MAPYIEAPLAIASLEFNVLEDSIPKISLTILGIRGILEAPPISSIDRFLKCSLENSILGYTLLLILLKADAISLSTGIMIF